MRVVYPKELQRGLVFNHWKIRHPIHIFGPQYAGISEAKMTRVLGYTRADADAIACSESMRYGVLAPTFIEASPFAVKHTMNTWILHTWGVNLESYETTDAKYVLEVANTKIINARYKQLLMVIFRIIKGAAEHVIARTGRPVVLRITQIGFGAWAVALPGNIKSDVLKFYQEQLLSMASDQLIVYFVDYPNDRTMATRLNTHSRAFEWKIAEAAHDPFGVPANHLDDSGMVIIPYPKNCDVILVNAWDYISYTGSRG